VQRANAVLTREGREPGTFCSLVIPAFSRQAEIQFGYEWSYRLCLLENSRVYTVDTAILKWGGCTLAPDFPHCQRLGSFTQGSLKAHLNSSSPQCVPKPTSLSTELEPCLSQIYGNPARSDLKGTDGGRENLSLNSALSDVWRPKLTWFYMFLDYNSPSFVACPCSLGLHPQEEWPWPLWPSSLWLRSQQSVGASLVLSMLF
jgi:hypothetical protein